MISRNFVIRDELSNNIISNCNFPFYKTFLSKKIKIVPDLAYLFLHKFKKKTSDEPHYDLLISYRNIEKYFSKHAIYLDNFIIGIQKLIRENQFKKIVIIDSDKQVDKSNSIYITKMLQNTFQNIEYLGEISFLDKIRILNESKFIISGRLHVAFCAFYFNKPFLILNYSDKNKAFVIENQIDKNCLIDYDYITNLNNLTKINGNNDSGNTIIDKKNSITLILNSVLK
jgi:polysaccharide pyruvyl transferase WcaK-like protein